MTLPSDEFAPLFTRLSDGRVRLTIDLRLYRLAAVQKAAYRLADTFTAILGDIHEQVACLDLVFPDRAASGDVSGAVRRLYQELLDQELREKVAEETQAVRALIIAQAFSRTDLIKRD